MTTPSPDCSNCSKFLPCDNQDRRAGFVCGLYTAWSDRQLASMGFSTSTPPAQLISHLGDDDQGTESEQVASLSQLLDEALDPTNVMPPDLKVDDRDLPQAPNFWEFCSNPDGLGQAPFPKQLIIFTHLFNEWCPKCTPKKFTYRGVPNCSFHEIERWPVDMDLSEFQEYVTLLNKGVCPKCKSTRSEMILDETLPNPMDGAFVIGQRAGKTAGTAMADAYITHWQLKMQNLGRLYRTTSSEHFTDTMVGLTFGRAKTLLFDPWSTFVTEAPWFKAYRALVREVENAHGEEIIIINKISAQFRHRQLVVHPMHPSKRLLRGDTRVGWKVDEFGWFQFGADSDDRERAGGKETYISLDRSCATVRTAYDKRIKEGYNNVPNAWGIMTSSPQAHNDEIMQFHRKFKNSRLAVTARMPTWDFNPDMPRTSSAIVKAYMDDPIMAERDFGANPPLSSKPFISDASEYLPIFGKRKNLLGGYKYMSRNTESGNIRRHAMFTRPPLNSGPCILTIDAGSSNNSFGLALGRIGKEGKVPQVLGLMEIAPGKGLPLDFAYIYREVISPIIIGCNVARVYVDRWQSLKIIHDIEADSQDRGRAVEGVQYSLRRNDFDEVMDYIDDANYQPELCKLEQSWEASMNGATNKYPHGFKYKPVSHLLFQLATVQENARSIDKGEGYTDDIFRAMMLLLKHLYSEDVVEWLATKAMGANHNINRGLFSTANYSGGSRTTSSGGSSGRVSMGSLSGGFSSR